MLARWRRLRESDAQLDKWGSAKFAVMLLLIGKDGSQALFNEGLMLQPGLIASDWGVRTGSKTTSAQRCGSAPAAGVFDRHEVVAVGIGVIGSTPLRRAIAFHTRRAPLEPALSGALVVVAADPDDGRSDYCRSQRTGYSRLSFGRAGFPGHPKLRERRCSAGASAHHQLECSIQGGNLWHLNALAHLEGVVRQGRAVFVQHCDNGLGASMKAATGEVAI